MNEILQAIQTFVNEIGISYIAAGAGIFILIVALTIFGLLREHRRSARRLKPQVKTVAETEAVTVPAAESTVSETSGKSESSETALTDVSATGSVQRSTFKLNPVNHELKDDFKETLQSLKETLVNMTESLAPFFIKEDGSLKRVCTDRRSDNRLDRLYRYWRAGFRDPDIAMPLLFYLEASRQGDYIRFLHELLTYRKLGHESTEMLKSLYYSELNLPEPDLQTLKEYRLPERLKLTIELINHPEKTLTRSQLAEIQRHFTSDLFELMPGLLYEKGNRQIRYLLEQKSSFKLNPAMPLTVVEAAILNCAAFHRYRDLPDSMKDFYAPFSKSRLALSAENFSKLLSRIRLCNNPGIITYAALKTISNSGELQKSEEIPQVSEDIDFSRVHPAVNRFYFEYFMKKSQYHSAESAYRYTGRFRNQREILLLYARLLFIREKYEQAWQLILELWTDNPDHVVIMNDAAIYAYHSGRTQEADEIFAKIRALYPDHPGSIHNEAVYIEKKMKDQLAERKKRLADLKQS